TIFFLEPAGATSPSSPSSTAASAFFGFIAMTCARQTHYWDDVVAMVNSPFIFVNTRQELPGGSGRGGAFCRAYGYPNLTISG
ncbi:MAG: hypothetical protein ACRCVA_29640, partial [Phreatobacter sp.]